MMKENIGIVPHSRPRLTREDQMVIGSVLQSGMIAEGKLVEKFEGAVSEYLGLEGGIATSSGTSALFLLLKGLDIGEGDEVIIPTYVCRSVWDAVVATGAQPIFCDVGHDWCMTLASVRPHITPQTKAIIVVHIFGIVAAVEPVCALGIPVIEDCCQALGATRDGKLAGTIADFCIASFHATKLLTTGEGGMVLTKDKNLLPKLRELKQGNSNRLSPRFRYPLTDLQAALGLSQLAQYAISLDLRRAISDYYFAKLEGLPVQLPHCVRDHSIFFRFPIRTKKKFEVLRASFDAKGIQVRKGVDSLLHRACGINSERFPAAEQCYAETLSIPIYPAMTEEIQRKVIGACWQIL